MDKKLTNDSTKQVLARNEERIRLFEKDFKEKIASLDSDDSVSRIQVLEEMVHSLKEDLWNSNQQYINDLLASVDKDGAAESKKENS